MMSCSCGCKTRPDRHISDQNGKWSCGDIPSFIIGKQDDVPYLMKESEATDINVETQTECVWWAEQHGGRSV